MSRRADNTKTIAALQKALEVESRLQRFYRITTVFLCLCGLILVADTIYLLNISGKTAPSRPSGGKMHIDANIQALLEMKPRPGLAGIELIPW